MKINRRDASFALAAAPMMAAAPASATTPRFDPVEYARWRHSQAPLRLRFNAKTEGQVKNWQRKLSLKVTDLLGGFPAATAPLAARSIETKDFGAYTREKFVFTSREGMEALAYLLKPAKASGPVPVMICVAGHGRGVDDLVGIDAQGKERSDKAGYMHDFAIQIAEGGAAALAIEPIAFGARRDPINAAKGLTANSCQPAAGAALLLGETMIGWRAYDVMRAIDYIETRKDLDAKRIGCMGISGGGTCALFATALEPRIKVAMITGYLCTFRDSILSLAHCMDNYIPGILNWAEMSDIAGLIAPRPLFVESGERDRIFPLAGFQTAVAETSKIYGVMGASEAFASEIHGGEHVFHGKRGIPFVLRHLGVRA